MTIQLYKNIEKLLILEKYIDILELTGLVNIKEKVENYITSRNKNLEKKEYEFTPIESLMDVILNCVITKVEKITYQDGPVLIYKPQEKIGKYRVDFVCYFWMFNEVKYIIECDGHNFHEKTKEQVVYDKQRERFLVSEGYKVLRYSGSEILNNFEQIKEELINLFFNKYMELNFGKDWREHYDEQ